jgi:hypothetical protein
MKRHLLWLLLTTACDAALLDVSRSDQDAESEDALVGRTQDATGTPTPPTVAPTVAPTAAPTQPPSQPPTEAPTAAPTEPPTAAPTEPPTAAPPGRPAHCVNGPLDGPIPNCRPAPPPSTGDDAADCVARINQLRAECQCLPPLGRWVEGEACADAHAEYDSTRGPHAGFGAGICPNGGFGQNECPGYNDVRHVIDVCLQQMWDEGPGADFQRHGHYLNMTNARFSQVACGFFAGPGVGMWAAQNFQ